MKIHIETPDLFLVYETVYDSDLEVILGIFKILYVAILLWSGSFLFMKDMNKFITIPLEHTFDTIKNHQMHIEDIYYNIDDYLRIHGIKAKKNIYDAEIQLIEMYYFKSSQNIIKILGLRSYRFFKHKILNFIENIDDSNINPFFKLRGVVMVIRLNIDEMISYLGENISIVYSKIIEMIDLTCLEHFGELLKFDNNTLLIFWDTKKITDKENEKHYDDDDEEDDNSHSENSNSYKIELDKLPNEQNEFKNILFSKIKNNAHKLLFVDLALISAIKILSRIKFEKTLNNLFYDLTGLNLIDNIKINIAIDKARITNYITYSDTRVESVYVSKSINQLKSKLVIQINIGYIIKK
jgi:protein required for attachment to host cells